MTIRISTLRPGWLISVKTSIKGNVSYKKIEGPTTIADDGSEHSEWEMQRCVKDPKEQAKAVEVRGKARAQVAAICANSDFGLLCPNDRKPDLEKAVRGARQMCEEFNADAKVTKLKFGVLAGYVEPSDAEAVRAIQGEVRELLDEMKSGLQELDADKTREAATRATRLATMLTDNVQAEIKSVVKAVRGQARKIAKASEQIAVVIDEAVLERIDSSRTMFLDFEPPAVQAPPGLSPDFLDLF